MTKTITINGREFEVTKREYKNMCDVIRTAGRTLNYYYNRPSTTKEAINNEWFLWRCETPNINFWGVSGANTSTFSYTAHYTEGEHEYILYITRDHNRAIIIK